MLALRSFAAPARRQCLRAPTRAWAVAVQVGLASLKDSGGKAFEIKLTLI
jgi:hypothetical protein